MRSNDVMVRANNVSKSLREEIGGRLAKIREHFDFSQSEMAEKIGVSSRSYQNYEQGKRELPSSLLFNLQESLGVSSHWLLTGQDGPLHRSPAKIAREAMEDIAVVAQTAGLSPSLSKIPEVLEIAIEQEMAMRPMKPDEVERILRLASDKK